MELKITIDEEQIKMIIFKDDIKAFKIAIKALEKQLTREVAEDEI